MSMPEAIPWTPEHVRDRLGGDFQVEGVLGQGAMGAVYRVNRQGIPFAVKVLLPQALANPDTLRRFLLEGEILRRLHHPAVLKVHAIGADPSFPYLVCDFVEGKSLDQWLGQRGPLPWATVFEMICPIIEGLGVAHREGILHRDIKPSNILVDAGGRCRLADFGIAKAEAMDSRKTATGLVMGTPAYMAPELILGARVTQASDIYSLGSVLFEMLTGEPPFPGDEVSAIFTAKLTGQLPLPTRRLEGLPRALDRLIAMTLARDPAERLPTAAALLQSIEDTRKMLNGASIGARTTVAVHAMPRLDEARTTAKPAAAETGRSHASSALVVVAAACALLLGSALFALRPPREARARPAQRGEKVAPVVQPLTEVEAGLVADILSCVNGGDALTRRLESVRDLPVERAALVLCEAWRGAGSSLRETLAAALGLLDHPLAIAPLVSTLADDPDPSSPRRRHAALRLTQLVSPGGLERGDSSQWDLQVQQLCALLKLACREGRNESPDVARAAIRCLAWLGSPRTDCVLAIREAPRCTSWDGGPGDDPDLEIARALEAIAAPEARVARDSEQPAGRSREELLRSIAGQR